MAILLVLDGETGASNPGPGAPDGIKCGWQFVFRRIRRNLRLQFGAKKLGRIVHVVRQSQISASAALTGKRFFHERHSPGLPQCQNSRPAGANTKAVVKVVPLIVAPVAQADEATE